MRINTGAGDAGHFLMDVRHQQIFDSIDRLEAMIGRGESAQALASVLDRALRYLALHFRIEEELMLEIGYPYLRVHQRLHEALLDAFETLKPTQARGALPSSAQLADLRQALIGHHDQPDRDLRLHIRYKGRLSHRPLFSSEEAEAAARVGAA